MGAAGQTVSVPTVEAMTIATTSQILVVYHLNTLEPNDFTASTTRGSALRTAAVDSFEQVLGSSQFTLGSVSGTRRSGVELTFVINAGVAVDINSLNAAMTSTGTSGFAQVFYTKATAAGQVVSMPTVTFVRWYYSDANNGDSSDAFPVWAIFFTVFMAIVIVPAIPTTKAEKPPGPRDPEVFCESFDEIQPPSTGSTAAELSTEAVSIEMGNMDNNAS